jgi:hypothetical protein
MKYDVHGSVHRYTTMKITNKMHLYRLIYYSKSALHVSGDVFAHHHEHLTVFRVSDSVNPSCCWLVSWMSWNWTMWVVWRDWFLNWTLAGDKCPALLWVKNPDIHRIGGRVATWVGLDDLKEREREREIFSSDVRKSVNRDTTIKITNNMHYID